MKSQIENGACYFQGISKYEDFKVIGNEWNNLYNISKVNNLFLTHQWLCNWIKHFGENRWVALIGRAGEGSPLCLAVVLRIDGRHIGFIEPLYKKNVPPKGLQFISMPKESLILIKSQTVNWPEVVCY